MDDKQIIELYWNRLELAIAETSQKYGRFCFSIANNILRNKEDSDECVNDSYLRVWNVIPPQKPKSLKAFLGKITRNMALHMWEKRRAKKRGQDVVTLALEELQECIPSMSNMEQLTEQIVLVEVLNQFLDALEQEKRRIFMARYYYFYSIKEIASFYNVSESKVKMVLFRSREILKNMLEKEGIVL